MNPDSVGSEYWPSIREGVNGSQKEARLEYAGGFIGGLEAYPGAGMLLIGTLAEVVVVFTCKIFPILVIKDLVLVPDTRIQKKAWKPSGLGDWIRSSE